MEKYISTSEAAKKWGLSRHRVSILCAGGRVRDAQLVGRTWMVPESAEKPADARIKSGKYVKSTEEKAKQYE